MIKLNNGDTLLLATHNQGKVKEFQEIFSEVHLKLVTSGDLGLPEPEETGANFRENAALKAKAAMKASGLPALADDSGFCVEALGGAPGIYSARWAQTENGGRDFNLAMKRVFEEVIKSGQASRRAKFVCVLCLALPENSASPGTDGLYFFEGEAAGSLCQPREQNYGFGYDPMFIPEGETRTYSEMLPEEKRKISHRTKAFELFKKEFFR